MIEFEDKGLNVSIGAGMGTTKTEFTNPISILKLRLNKLIATNKEKKRLVDQYLRNVRIIEDAFD